jgi:hypothetical protein
MLDEEKARGIGAGIQPSPRKCGEGRCYNVTELIHKLQTMEQFTQIQRMNLNHVMSLTDGKQEKAYS